MLRKILLASALLIPVVAPIGYAQTPNRPSRLETRVANLETRIAKLEEQLKALRVRNTLEHSAPSENTDVPPDVMARIKTAAEEAWPNNYHMQKFNVDRDVQAYKEMNQ